MSAGPGASWLRRGVARLGWTLSSERRQEKRREAERLASERRVEEEREERRAALEALLSAEPFAGWVRAGALTDHLARYRRLVETRDEIARLAHEREEVELVLELFIRRLLDRMLDVYLQFAAARVSFLKLLVTLERERPAPPPAPPEVPPAVPLTRAASALDRLPFPFAAPPEAAPELPDAARLVRELSERIAELKEAALREPAAAGAREWHVAVLEKQRALLAGWSERDRAVEAQLEVFPDAFHVVLSRVSAARFDAGDVSSTMEAIAARVEETERFVKAFAPAMDEALARSA